MSDSSLDELRSMLVAFRVSELQMLLGYAGRNKSGRKHELQQRALQLLRVRSHPIHNKIRALYKTIQQSSGSPSSNEDHDLIVNNGETVVAAMPQQPHQQQQGNASRTATAMPFSVDNRQLTNRQPLYNQNMYQPQQYTYPPQNRQQQQQQPPLVPANYPVHPDVKFKRLPFFDVIAELLKPSSLVPQNSQRLQEGTFYFHLTPQQATDVASTRDIRPGSKLEYPKQIQLRFCLLETTCEQEDCFPPNVVVKINNKMCPLPNPIPTNKPGVEPKRPPRPVNISPNVKLSPTVANMINVQWAADYGRGYAITVALVHKRTSSDLLTRLKTRGVKHSDFTRALIKEKLQEDADSEIATTSLRVSLMCPLGKMRMMTPCRATTCQHLQCFDALLFLQMNERKPTWNCPVCDKPALYDTLVIDGYFQEVLGSNSLANGTSEIELHKDGSWSVQNAEKKPVVPKPDKVPLEDSIEIISDDVEVVTSETARAEATSTEKPQDEPPALVPSVVPVAASAPAPSKSVVDLTVSDSDDDDEPLAKRRAPANPKPDSTIKFSDGTGVSSSTATGGDQQARATATPGPSSVSSSGYPASPALICLDSPSPPRSPSAAAAAVGPNGNVNGGTAITTSMPVLDLESEVSNTGYTF